MASSPLGSKAFRGFDQLCVYSGTQQYVGVVLRNLKRCFGFDVSQVIGPHSPRTRTSKCVASFRLLTPRGVLLDEVACMYRLLQFCRHCSTFEFMWHGAAYTVVVPFASLSWRWSVLARALVLCLCLTHPCRCERHCQACVRLS